MIIKDLSRAMLHVINQAGTIKIEHLRTFFDSFSVGEIAAALKSLAVYKYIDFDTNIVRARKLSYSAEEEKQIHAAFSIIADYGCRAVKDLWRASTPSQFIFYTEDNALYDITFIKSESAQQTAALVNRLWSAYQVDGYPDCVNHIAVTYEDKIATALKKMGFDFVVTIDAEGTRKYHD